MIHTSIVAGWLPAADDIDPAVCFGGADVAGKASYRPPILLPSQGSAPPKCIAGFFFACDRPQHVSPWASSVAALHKSRCAETSGAGAAAFHRGLRKTGKAWVIGRLIHVTDARQTERWPQGALAGIKPVGEYGGITRIGPCYA